MITNNLYNLERTISSEEAIRLLRSILEKEKLTSKYLISNDAEQVSQVQLNGFDDCTHFGSGKGISHEIGALAESIEHYFLDNEQTELIPLEPMKILSVDGLKKDGHLINVLSEVTDSPIQLQCVKFHSLNDSEMIYLPVCYVRPNSYSNETSKIIRNLKKYSTNSGVSFGLTFFDSVLHGVNEIIERHYTSLLILSLLGYETQTTWKIIHERELMLNKKLQNIKNTYDGKVLSIQAVTKFGTYYTATFFFNNIEDDFLITPIGMGNSIFPKLSFHRSIDELNQYLYLYSHHEYLEDRDTLSQLQEFQKLNCIAKINPQHLKKICTEFTPEESRINYRIDKNLSTEMQFNQIANTLYEKKYCIFFRTIKEFENGGVVTQCYIPGMERFNLIRSGNLVRPSSNYPLMKGPLQHV